ncbi:TetR-like C-terminal domain-containing protein [Nocardia gipuzkoensis]
MWRCLSLRQRSAGRPARLRDRRRGSGWRSARPLRLGRRANRRWAEDLSVPTTTLHRAVSFWTRLHGVLSLELAGHFTGMEFDPALLFADELNTLVTD